MWCYVKEKNQYVVHDANIQASPGSVLGRPLVFRDVFPCPSLMFCLYYISPSLVYN